MSQNRLVPSKLLLNSRITGVVSRCRRPCSYGVPQGSVLGHALFDICTSSLVSVIASVRNVRHDQYASDIHPYIALSTDGTISVINDCSQSIHRWLDANRLWLNPDHR